MKHIREVAHIIEAELNSDELKSVEFIIEKQITHPKVKFLVNNISIKIPFPGSPSCARWKKNFRATLRQYIRGARDGMSPHELRQSLKGRE